MLMVIFGAGASYDSDSNRPAGPTGVSNPTERIPLAKELFGERFGLFAAHYPASQGLMKRLRAAGADVEPALEAIRAESAHKTFLVRQLEAVRYYLRALIQHQEENWLRGRLDGITNYVDLLQEIEDWREERREDVALVTFNYDLLLDRACRSVVPEMRLAKMSDYGRGNVHWLFKLHGSTDWYEELEQFHGDRPSGSGLEYDNALIDLTGSISVTGRYARYGETLEGESWGPMRPAIAIPMVTKKGDDFACPVQHLRNLAQMIPLVSGLVVVGWRGEEQHFHQLWRRAVADARKTQLRSLLVVDASSDGAEAIGGRLRDGMDLSPGVTAQIVGEGFSGALSSGVFARFLRQ